MIAEKTKLPLVMHGGSGVNPGDYIKSIELGIRKINCYTYMAKAGGTAVAACNLVKKVGAEVAAAAFIIELDPLKGREKIEAKGVKVVSMLNYDLD